MHSELLSFTWCTVVVSINEPILRVQLSVNVGEKSKRTQKGSNAKNAEKSTMRVALWTMSLNVRTLRTPVFAKGWVIKAT